MKQPRFILTDMGLVLETPIPLTPRQRYACQIFAESEYKRRLKGLPSGDRRDNLIKVIEALQKGNFVERAVPEYDSSKEVHIYGS